jgi:hypothetical protein
MQANYLVYMVLQNTNHIYVSPDNLTILVLLLVKSCLKDNPSHLGINYFFPLGDFLSSCSPSLISSLYDIRPPTSNFRGTHNFAENEAAAADGGQGRRC